MGDDYRGREAGDVSSPLRTMPANNEAEMAVLGSMLLLGEAVEQASAILRPEDFFKPSHQIIYRAMLALHQQGTVIDHVSLADKLEIEGTLAEAGGKSYLLSIATDIPNAANVESYAGIVERNAILRDVITAATHIVARGYDRPDNVEELLDEAERLFQAASNRRLRGNFLSITELLGTAFKHLEDLFEAGEHVTGVKTGFEGLDKLLAGLHKSDLIVLAARPSVGKTALALNMAVAAAKTGTSVAFFSLEMASEQLVQRVLCTEARVNLSELRRGWIKESEWGQIHDAMGELAKLDFWVDDNSVASIRDIRTKARRQLSGKPNGLIVIDYLQLMQAPPGRRSENRQVEISEISRGLKQLAKELEVPVLALSQLSRAVETRSNKRPQLSDIRESGAIEQDADVVMFIDRNTDPRNDEEGSDRPGRGTAEIIVAKHRNGPTGGVPVIFKEQYTAFVDQVPDKR